MFKCVCDIIDGNVAYDSSNGIKKHTRAITMTNGAYLSDEGRDLKAKVMSIKQFYSELRPKTTNIKRSSDF